MAPAPPCRHLPRAAPCPSVRPSCLRPPTPQLLSTSCLTVLPPALLAWNSEEREGPTPPAPTTPGVSVDFRFVWSWLHGWRAPQPRAHMGERKRAHVRAALGSVHCLLQLPSLILLSNQPPNGLESEGPGSPCKWRCVSHPALGLPAPHHSTLPQSPPGHSLGPSRPTLPSPDLVPASGLLG